MKQSIRFLTILVTGMFMIASVVSAAVTLSNPASIPTEYVAIVQSNTMGPAMQARNRASNSSDWRMITQEFQWNSWKKLDGIGLYFSSSQPAWSADQDYSLIIQAINVATHMPTSNVAQIRFSLPSGNVGASQWLYIDFDDLGLDNGQWYGFTFCPPADAVDGALRTYWATSNGDIFPGRATQDNPQSSGLPKTTVYNNNSFDYAMYMLEEPDDLTLSNPLDPPTGNNVVITQYVTGGAVIQARRTGGFRGITQTFWWPTDRALDKLGLFLNNTTGNDWASDMLYVMCVQALNGNSPTSTVAELEFSLDAAHMGASQWIQFDLKNNLSLNSNQWYGFTLSPVDRETASLRSYWETGSSAYPGRGAQNDPSADGIPKATDYGSAGVDYTMYFTVPIPEPATIVLFGVGFLALSLRKNN